jgi:transcriptional regulator with XRE-family HTH domain
MTNTDAERLNAAMIDELRAEIAVAYPSTKEFAVASDMDYTTLIRYLRGEREMKLITLIELLGVLNLDLSAFFDRASERANR